MGLSASTNEERGMAHLAVKPSPQHVLARIISAVIHPIVLPLVTLGVLSTLAPGGSLMTAVRLVVVGLLVSATPIAALVLIQVSRGKWTDADVSVRRQRYLLYPFGIACMLASAVVFAVMRAPWIAVQATLGAVAANVVNGLINLKYKVSAHATTSALCAVLLWRGLPAPESAFWGGSVSLAALLVGWSRVALGRHTRGQVILGWAVGVVVGAATLLMPWSFAL